MTTNMNFGPEWMRGGVPKRSNTLDAQGLRSANSSSGTPGFFSNRMQSNNSGSAYSSVREQGSSTNANDSLGDSFDMRSNNTSENKSGPTYKYSKEFMLGLYKPVDVPADFERHDYVVVEESQGPLSFTDLTEEEKKLLAGPVHSEIGRRIITTGGDRPNNSRNNSHRDLHGSPAQSPGSENLPNTPGRMNLPRSKGRMHDYFSRRNDQDGARQREWSHSDSDKGPENSQEEIAWGGVNRDTVGSFDSDGVFRLGGSNCATSGALEDRSGRDWQAGFDTSIAKDFKRRGYDQQNDEISRDTFGTGQLRGSPFSDGINPTFGRGMESAHAPSAFSAETDFRDASPAASKPPSAYKWFYRDPQGNVQGPFDAQEMQGWYKSGFFTPTLLVKREDDVQFEPLMALIRRVGNDSEPFLTPAQTETIDSPASSHAAGLNLGLSSRTRGLDPFSRPSPSASSLLGGSTPLDTASGNLFGVSSAASDILSPQAGGFDFGGKYNTLGGIGGLQSSFLQQQLGQGAGTPQSPSLLQSPFGGTFGPSFLGSRDGASPWGERPRTPAWLNSGQSDMYGGAESPGISSLLQRQQQHGLNPLFGPTASSPGYMDYQRTMNDHMNQHQQYLQMLQQKQQQHLQFQQQLQQQLQQQQALESAGLSPHSPQSSGLGQGAFAANQSVPQSLETENRRLPGSVPVSTNSPSIHSGWGSAPGTPLSKSDRPVASRIQNKLAEQTEAVDIEPAAAKEKDQEEEALAQSMAKASIEAEPKPAPEPSPKEPATKPPSTVSKPVSLRDIQAEELRKQQEAKLQQQQQQQQAAKAAAASSENATAASTTSTKSGWGNSPWGLESTTKGPSLREIQEMEAREAEARKQAEAQQAATAASRISSSSSNTSWGVVTPSKTASSASVSTSAPAWGTTTAPKKTLREIQQEEEEAALRRAKAQQQAAANTMASSISSGAIPSSGRGYAGIAENAAAKATSSAGWTTVSAQRTQARITTSSTAPPSTTSHSSNTNRSTNTQNAWEPVGAPKQSPSVQQTAASRPAASAANNPKNSKTDGNKPPSDEFCRWCRQSLRGLNPGVNAEEILQMLLSFPLDNSSAEIIQDIIYANSTSMDGRRFADEFMKRRKADMAGKLSVTFPSTTLEDESAFQVVTKKGKKKTQA